LVDANPAETWPSIALTWRQSVAAFWCVAWPALLIWFLIIGFWPTKNMFVAGAVGSIFSIFVQAAFLPRLVRKKFHLFRIGVLRDDDPPSHDLSLSEIARVAPQVLWPQFAFLVAAGVLTFLFGGLGHGVQGIDSLVFLLRFLLIGPWAVNLATRRKYVGFRLQPFGIRYI